MNGGAPLLKVYLIWSGETSKRVASALHQWLPYILPPVRPSLRTEISKGDGCGEVLKAQLRFFVPTETTTSTELQEITERRQQVDSIDGRCFETEDFKVRAAADHHCQSSRWAATHVFSAPDREPGHTTTGRG